MCRSIKVLRNPEQPPTPDEIHAAALQFVRKISGFTKPSQANQQAFDTAVLEIAATSRTLLASLVGRGGAQGSAGGRLGGATVLEGGAAKPSASAR